MEDVGSVPSLKVVLLGPSGAGKSTFLAMLLEEPIGDAYVPTERTVIKQAMRKYYKYSGGRYVFSEQYKLTVADTPGSKDKTSERRKGIEKSVVGLFFYDLTDPRSPRELETMITNDIVNTESYYNLMGIVVIGCKKDIGPNSEALAGGAKIASSLTQLISDLWGYKVPHLAINCRDKEEVQKAFYIAESLAMDKPPANIIEELSAENIGRALPTTITETPPTRTLSQPLTQHTTAYASEAPRPVVQEDELVPERKAVVPPHLRNTTTPPQASQTVQRQIIEPREEPRTSLRGEAISATVRTMEATYRILPHDSDKIWETVAKLHQSRSEEVEAVYFIKKAGEILLVAYSPGDKSLSNLNKSFIANAIQFERTADSLATDNGLELPKFYIVSGENRSLFIVKRKNAILVLRVRGFPSGELINLLV